MFIFKKAGGELEVAPEGFDPDNPDLAMLEDVEEVLVVSKVLVKQVKLVPKAKEEIARVRKKKEISETPKTQKK